MTKEEKRVLTAARAWAVMYDALPAVPHPWCAEDRELYLAAKALPSRSESIAEAIVRDGLAQGLTHQCIARFVIDGQSEDISDVFDAWHEGFARQDREKEAARLAARQGDRYLRAPAPSKTQLGFTDADGYVRHVEINVDPAPGNESTPEKP
jgi:hypothetical protein